ncbi:thioredoxin domain-containing protein [Variovorax robiniae]|uniref:Thioredoxin domain-containing protein n=1 Tax=Variovorax robiniae TaxID=1836199 RepID=A0ABU8X9U7_9BURK
MKRTTWVIGTALLLVGAFAVGAFFYAGTQERQTATLAQSHGDALARPGSPMYGSPSAKVTIVEFFDPACETCRAFYPVVKSIVNASFGQVNLVVRYVPLHKGSDDAVRILEAARLQDKYWQVVEAVLAAQPIWASHDAPQPALIWDHLQGTGLDVEKARSDVNDPRIQRILAQDIEDASALGVRRTPGFFVNGKPLADFGVEQLKALVSQEVRAVNSK